MAVLGNSRPRYRACLLLVFSLRAAAGVPVEATLDPDLDRLEVRRCPIEATPACLTQPVPLPRRGDGRIASYFNLASDVRLLELATANRLAALAEDNGSGLLRFQLPPGMQVSAPWPLVERTSSTALYRLTGSPAEWDGRLGLGRLHQFNLDAAGSRVRVSVLNGDPAPRIDELSRWLQFGVDAVSSVYGRFPLQDVQVLVTPVGPTRGEVPWGQVMRGGYPAVHLFVDHTDPFERLLDDWTLFHEISHLFIPLVSRRDMWLAEGLASYYQTVARARAGQISPEIAWQKLLDGMDKGIDQADGRPFNEVLAARDWSTIRLVYWTGAAIMLKADIALRQRSNNQQSLDTVLDAFQRCCLPSQELWPAHRLLRRFDQLAGGDPVFQPLARAYLEHRGFPDIDRDLAALGVERDRDKTVRLDETAPLSAVAAGIMARASDFPRGQQSPVRDGEWTPLASPCHAPADCRPPGSPPG